MDGPLHNRLGLLTKQMGKMGIDRKCNKEKKVNIRKAVIKMFVCIAQSPVNPYFFYRQNANSSAQGQARGPQNDIHTTHTHIHMTQRER